MRRYLFFFHLIKYLFSLGSKFVQKIKNMYLVILLTLLTCIFCQSRVKSQSYVWINYNQPKLFSKHKDRATNEQYYAGDIPCQTRLKRQDLKGSRCNFNYTLLPLGWTTLAPQNYLLIPAEAYLKNSLYSINVELSDLTGEKLDARLVVIMQNGLLKVQDRASFLKRNNFPYTQSDASRYIQSRLNILQGRKDQQQIKLLISQNKIELLNQYIQQIIKTTRTYTNKCRMLIDHLNDIQEIMQSKLSQIQNYLKEVNNQIKTAKEKIKNLQRKRRFNLEDIVNSRSLYLYQLNQTLQALQNSRRYLQNQNSFLERNSEFLLKQYSKLDLKPSLLNLNQLEDRSQALIRNVNKLRTQILDGFSKKQSIHDTITKTIFRSYIPSLRSGQQKQIRQIRRNYQNSRKMQYQYEANSKLKQQYLKHKTSDKKFLQKNKQDYSAIKSIIQEVDQILNKKIQPIKINKKLYLENQIDILVKYDSFLQSEYRKLNARCKNDF